MEIRIGIKHSPRELSFDTDATSEEVRALIDAAIAGDNPFITFADVKGREYFVHTDSLAYIEFGGDTSRKVGFVS